MAKGAGRVITGIVTLIIGGTVYSVSQGDIASIFSEETGMSQTEAEQYVENISEDDLVPFDEIGSDLVAYGEEFLSYASEIDCVDYYYDWETDKLTCKEGKLQLEKFGDSEIALGEAYKILSSESASEADMHLVIRLIDKVNENYSLEIIAAVLDQPDIDEDIKSNLYNKALLQAAINSD